MNDYNIYSLRDITFSKYDTIFLASTHDLKVNMGACMLFYG